MGADERMYPGPWRSLPNIHFIDWNTAAEATTIQSLASLVRERLRIEDGCVLVGSSLGGMVAAELCRQVRTSRLFLLGSAVHPTEIGAVLRIAAPLAETLPIRAAQQLARELPAEVFQMFQAADPEFVRKMCRAIVSWDGYRNGGEMLHRIHGSRDMVIPPPAQADLVLDAGHLIAMTHATECVRFVRERLGLEAASRPAL